MSKAKKAIGILFGLAVWQIGAMLLDKSIILPSPSETAEGLAEIIIEREFLPTLLNSVLRITSGLLAGLAAGIILALLSKKYDIPRIIITPVISAVKTVPVASFIIFALFWISSINLSLLISFLIVVPVIYDSVYSGLEAADKKLLEMAEVYQLSAANKLRYIYLPAMMPAFSGAVSAAVGLAVKSGTAAEVIARPDYTLGEMLYSSKIYLETDKLFAWTVIIILSGKAVEYIMQIALKWLYQKLQRVK